MRLLGVLLISAVVNHSTARACSCSQLTWAPACQLVSRAQVVFLGTVLRGEPNPPPRTFMSTRVYRLQVDRTYKGLAPGLGEITIGPVTPCQTAYAIGRQYLMFANVLRTGPHSQVYVSDECSGSRLAQFAKGDIEFLESALQGKSSTRVYGKTLQWVWSLGRHDDNDNAPVAGALVTLQSEKESRTQISGADGSYLFDRLVPGDYTLAARLTPFVPDPPSQAVTVAPGGCVEAFLQLEPQTELSGYAADHNGAPAAKTKIELLRKGSTGNWYSTSQFWTYTNSQGHFKFEDIPTGQYLLGHEIRHALSVDSAIPTTYYPGVSEQVKARVITLAANNPLRGVRIALSPRDRPRQVTIKVTRPDGKPPGSHLLQIFVNDQLIENIGGISYIASAISAPPTNPLW